MVRPIRRREAFMTVREDHPGLSQRRACGLVGLSRNAVQAPTTLDTILALMENTARFILVVLLSITFVSVRRD